MLLSASAISCRGPEHGAPAAADAAPGPQRGADAAETDCAWFGSARGGTLWFGVSAFWSAMRRTGGDPGADLATPGGIWLGRHDLGQGRTSFERLGRGPGGTWDVFAHPNGRVYLTTFFDVAGVRHRDGRFERLGPRTRGLAELAPGPAGRILASRYGSANGAPGAVVVLGEDGRVQAEFPLAAPPGMRAAAKSLAWDPLRGEIWVNTDLVPEAPDAAVRHDTRVLSAGGRERFRFVAPEVQFMTFGPDGTGYFAEVDRERLRLRIRPPEAAVRALAVGRWIALDDDFPSGTDFVQELTVDGAGRVVVTRWSGRVHVVDADGRVRSLDFPRAEGDLYYTGVLDRGRVCATTCRTAPEPVPAAWVRCLDLPD